MSNESPEQSQEQHDWRKLAALFRARLYSNMPENMPPDVFKTYSEALINAYWLDHHATTFDAQVEKEQRGFE